MAVVSLREALGLPRAATGRTTPGPGEGAAMPTSAVVPLRQVLFGGASPRAVASVSAPTRSAPGRPTQPTIDAAPDQELRAIGRPLSIASSLFGNPLIRPFVAQNPSFNTGLAGLNLASQAINLPVLLRDPQASVARKTLASASGLTSGIRDVDTLSRAFLSASPVPRSVVDVAGALGGPLGIASGALAMAEGDPVGGAIGVTGGVGSLAGWLSNYLTAQAAQAAITSGAAAAGGAGASMAGTALGSLASGLGLFGGITSVVKTLADLDAASTEAEAAFRDRQKMGNAQAWLSGVASDLGTARNLEDLARLVPLQELVWAARQNAGTGLLDMGIEPSRDAAVLSDQLRRAEAKLGRTIVPESPESTIADHLGFSAAYLPKLYEVLSQKLAGWGVPRATGAPFIGDVIQAPASVSDWQAKEAAGEIPRVVTPDFAGRSDVVEGGGWKLPTTQRYEVYDQQGGYAPVSPQGALTALQRGEWVFDRSASRWVQHGDQGASPHYRADAPPWWLTSSAAEARDYYQRRGLPQEGPVFISMPGA